MFFVYMDDEEGFEAVRGSLPREHRADLEIGRSLALAFTGVDRPATILRHLTAAPDASELAARLTGVTWALAARRLNDREYFTQCIRQAGADAALLERLPAICHEARERAESYADWQARTRDGVTELWATSVRG